MEIINWIIVTLWLIFLLYWLISSFNVKRNIKQPQSGVRYYGLFIVVLVIIVSAIPSLQGYIIRQTLPLQVVATLIIALGLGLAIWARVYLGTNWSPVPSIKEGHELVVSGPYRIVRHPIYTGILLAILGSALISAISWFVVFIGVTLMFIWRISLEERYMLQLFPDQYLEYRRRTKALIPFVW